MKRLASGLVLACLLSGCIDDSGNNSLEERPMKYGIISNSCGPSDAPVVDLRLTDEEIVCSTDLRTIPQINTYLEFSNTQDISIGMMLEPHTYGPSGPMSARECDIGFVNCKSIGLLSIEITGQDNATFQGVFSTDLEGSVSEGDFIIQRCNNERPLCG